MSARADILGWVIRRLSEIDAADESQRADLFRRLRDEVAAGGFSGAAAADALPHLESAIARQEMHWLRETAANSATAPQAPSLAPTVAGAKPRWYWPDDLALPAAPPGPAPVAPAGPFSDHVYAFVTLAIPGGTAELNIGWAHDPACVLTATCPEIGFSFRTRAANFTYAVDHLAGVLARGGLDLPDEVRSLDL
ncbi:MAG: hypothetical protein FP825_08210 [Hyphomonas sp.]|uniref:hypothetical protein n=1 Tax=Hyphomonas sp. TaxID=87 RepID=UPI001816D788|nr:hypothetical protein [Hyphomonas sp.]MBU3920467.1 hypothetical protein [Alphaproteobacteria bacterium]MBA3068447.1 hypothetical protein [Hyphomonas sp.]MBU4060686.1 hypothetical protein [Alphaproteobacteria bacterium]MBU4164670.1 hypothetical protein [Alphaproteobacteria bacterium]MBU4568993.1 hypothetical protein [Alphaproteobacteria bacterium]